MKTEEPSRRVTNDKRRKNYATALIAPVLAGGAMLVATQARAEPVDIRWDAKQRFERAFEVLPGKFAEVCGKLSRGQAIAWRFEANGAVDFNVHYHDGGRVVFPAKQDAVTRAADTLEVNLDQDYCWMWTNKSADTVRLQLGLQR